MFFNLISKFEWQSKDSCELHLSTEKSKNLRWQMPLILKHESRCRSTLELSFKVGDFHIDCDCVCMCVCVFVQQNKLPSNWTKNIPQCSQKIKFCRSPCNYLCLDKFKIENPFSGSLWIFFFMNFGWKRQPTKNCKVFVYSKPTHKPHHN